MERSGAKWKLGQLGEQIAAEFLVRKGYELLTRNMVVKQGEIDILMHDGAVIVIVEVKTQKSDAFRDPIFQIGTAKQKKLRLLGEIIALQYSGCNVRVDAVTVVMGDAFAEPVITHLQNVL